jgi:hypothetical protein
MKERERGPGTAPRRGTGASRAKPGEGEKHGKSPPGIPGHEAGAPAESQQPESSEDFGGRRDIETADVAPEQHDRFHHDRGRRDVESGRPA